MKSARIHFNRIASSKNAFICYALVYILRFTQGELPWVTLNTTAEPLGKIQWHIAISLLLSWILVFVSLMRSIKTSVKVVYVIVLLPYTIMLVLLIRSLSLPGAAVGLMELVTPNFSRLRDLSVWINAAAQVLFSLGIGYGCITTLASYNKQQYNFYRDAIIICIVDFMTALTGSVTTFAILGYVSHKTGQPVSRVVHQGTSGFAFIVYTEAAASMPLGSMWSCLFFIMLLTLGIDTQFFCLETPMTALMDKWPGLLADAKKETGIKAIYCLALFALALPMCCQGGIFLYQIFDTCTEGLELYVLALGEIIGVCCFYGLSNFLDDLKTMLEFEPGMYWIACWTVVAPIMLLVVIVFSLVTYTRPAVGDGSQEMSDWGEALGWGIVLMTILIIVAFAVMWRPSLTLEFDPLRSRLRKASSAVIPSAMRRAIRIQESEADSKTTG